MRSKTYVATPPGETIREQLEDRSMSQKEFAARMEMSEKHQNYHSRLILIMTMLEEVNCRKAVL